MAKTKTQSRRPVRARGTIPAPKVTPGRRRTVWYRRRGVQITAAVVIAGLGFLIVKAVLSSRSQTKALRTQTQAFERRINTMQSQSAQILQQMNSSPGEFQSGKLPADKYGEQTAQWLVHLRKNDQSLRAITAPDGLLDARALFVNANLIYLDAAKAFAGVTATVDTAARDRAIGEAKALLAHGQSLFSLAQRELIKYKVEIGLGDASTKQLLDQAPTLPNEQGAAQNPSSQLPVPPIPGQPANPSG